MFGFFRDFVQNLTIKEIYRFDGGVTHTGCSMRVLREPQMISGFIYDQPIDDLPALTHCGEALCCRGHSLAPHSHFGFEFLYCTRGVCHWEVARSSFRQTMGDLFIAHPRELHGTGSKCNSENRHVWMGLCLDRIGPDGSHLAHELRKRQIRVIPGCHEVESLLQTVISQVATLRPRRAEVVSSLLHAFIALISQRLVLLNVPGSDFPHPALPYSLAVRKAVTYMQRNLDRRILLADLAAVATVRSVAQFCSKFHREVGTTPAHFHVQMRLEAAREALHQPSASITDVALEFGFSSSQHFSTHFRRTFNLTPRQWQLSPATRRKARLSGRHIP